MRLELSVAALAVAVSLACCSSEVPQAERTAASTSAIQGGMTDTTHSFVVAVVQQGVGQSSFTLCSGSLLAPNLVATARHCIAQPSSDNIDCTTTTFGAAVSPSTVAVTTDPDLSTAIHFYDVQQIITPPGKMECGNDLALLILKTSVSLPEYVTPVVDPPMTDHAAYSTTVTAIGYGITSPTDTNGTTAGLRRIRENIDLACISNDTSFPDCLQEPLAVDFITANEFESGSGVCDGDSGSGAFEQRNFDAGNWVSFGVLSRGGLSFDGGTCVAPIYTRFDAWGSLLASTAATAAQVGGYATPAWAVALGAEAGVPAAKSPSAEASSSTTPACLAVSSTCGTDTDCCSVNCVSHDGTTFLCASCDNANPCNTGYVCDDGTCVRGNGSAGGNASAGGQGAGQSSSSDKGCSFTPMTRTSRGSRSGWLSVAAGMLLGGLLRRKFRQRAVGHARTSRVEAA